MTVGYTSAWCLIEFIPREGAGDRFTVDVRDFPFITQVQVTKNLGLVSEITITFDAPFTEGLRILNNEIAKGMLLAGTIVRVKMGYGDTSLGSSYGRHTEDFVGYLNKGGIGLQLEPTGLSGAIKAVGIAPQAARSLSTKSKTVGQEFDLRVLFAGYNLGYEVDPPAREQFDALMKRDLKDLYSSNVGAVRHIEFIESVLYEADLCMEPQSFVSDNGYMNTGFKVQKVTSANLITPFVFVMRGGFDYDAQGNPTSYPIISFAPDSNAGVYYAGITPDEVSLMSADIDMNGELIAATVDQRSANVVASTSKTTPTTPNPQDTVRDGNASNRSLERQDGKPNEYGSQQITGPVEVPNLIASMYERLRGGATRFVPGLSATLTTFGIPQVKSNTFVVVRNVGNFYEGVYRIMGFTHAWSGTDIETTLTLRAYTPENNLPIVEPIINYTANIG